MPRVIGHAPRGGKSNRTARISRAESLDIVDFTLFADGALSLSGVNHVLQSGQDSI
jgi:hypothetical protein